MLESTFYWNKSKKAMKSLLLSTWRCDIKARRVTNGTIYHTWYGSDKSNSLYSLAIMERTFLVGVTDARKDQALSVLNVIYEFLHTYSTERLFMLLHDKLFIIMTRSYPAMYSACVTQSVTLCIEWRGPIFYSTRDWGLKWHIGFCDKSLWPMVCVLIKMSEMVHKWLYVRLLMAYR